MIKPNKSLHWTGSSQFSLTHGAVAGGCSRPVISGVISMNPMAHNPLAKRAVTVPALLIAATLMAWFSFHQGERRVASKGSNHRMDGSL